MNFGKLFLFSFYIFLYCLPVIAADKVDYDKPFDEIQSTISAFDNRHSLMDPPVEEETITQTYPVPQGESNQSSVVKVPVVVSPATTTAPSSNVSDEKKSIEVSNIAVVPDYEREPVVVSGSDEVPVVLRPIHREKVIKPINYDELINEAIENQNQLKSNLIEERASTMVSKPLFDTGIVEKTPHENFANTSVPVVQEVNPKNVDSYEIEDDDFDEEGNNNKLAHVASYATEETAREGIVEMEKKYPHTSIFEPYVSYEYVKGKGNFYRLYFIGDVRELEYLCREMKKNLDWCNILK